MTLTKRQDFVLAANSGMRCRTSSVLLQSKSLPDPSDGAIKLGFTATKKLGNAVIRNRAKRRMRAAARECLLPLARTDRYYVLVAREGLLEADYDTLCRDLRYAANRLNAME